MMRTGRATLFAAVCVLLATLGHVLMSGASVPWWALGAAFAGTAGGVWWLADRERGPALVTGLTVGVQTALHLLFSLGQADSGGAVRSVGSTGPGAAPSGGGLTVEPVGMVDMAGMHIGMAGMGSHLHAHAHQAVTAAAVPPHQGGGTVGMLVAHLLAALLTGLWLAAGERSAFRLLRTAALRLLAPLLLLLRVACPPYRPALRPRRFGSPRRPRQLLLVHAITSRGPPVGSAAG
ncbi:hypothetical protein [Kitasatospora sp. NPDC051914]|uniref:hypothetical protein n=1 Tax=Kitasatospora sp. NPDC051914 TaxID=3154945 RepID=UPI003414A694